MLVVDGLISREEQEFIAENLLHVYCIVQPRRNSQTHMYDGNHYLCFRKPNQSQTMLVTDSFHKDLYLNDFVWFSGQWEFQADEPSHFSIPRQKGYIPMGKRKSIF